jgi:hypothetical protein
VDCAQRISPFVEELLPRARQETGSAPLKQDSPGVAPSAPDPTGQQCVSGLGIETGGVATGGIGAGEVTGGAEVGAVVTGWVGSVVTGWVVGAGLVVGGVVVGGVLVGG